METCGGELDTGTQWDSQWALHRAPRVTLRSASAVEGALNLTACLHLWRDCPRLQQLTDPSLPKEVSFLFPTSLTSVSLTLWVRDTPKLQLFPPALPGDTNHKGTS